MPPQFDSDTSAAAGISNGKITCENLATDDDPTKNDEEYQSENNPPESFFLSNDAVYEWFDRNAILERKESTKGGHTTTLRSNSATSHRFSVNLKSKSKASIIGLPKTQKTTFVADSKRRTTSMPLFPKRSDSVAKSLVEPGSPKVSCMGRVRSKRCPRRSNSSKRKEKRVLEKKKSSGGIYSKVMSMFRSKKGSKKAVRSVSMDDVEPDKHVSVVMVDEPVAVEPPGLGGMKRFVSGRRTGSWSGEDLLVVGGARLVEI